MDTYTHTLHIGWRVTVRTADGVKVGTIERLGFTDEPRETRERTVGVRLADGPFVVVTSERVGPA